jgi:hypothetical protein
VTLVLFAVTVGHLTFQVLLQGNLLALVVELRVHRAKALRKEGVASGEFKKELWLSRGNYVSDPPGDVFSTGIEVLIT